MRIKELMKERGISQKELAERIGITSVGMYNVLKSENPRMFTLNKIAKELCVEVWELFVSREDVMSSGDCSFFAQVHDGDKDMHFTSKRDLVEWLVKQ